MKRIILIDNVNNISGAPMICKEISDVLNLEIYSQRKSTSPVYQSKSYGLISDSAFMYPFSILCLLFKPRFLIDFIKSDTVICNTSLTWFYCLLGFIFKKNTILVLHESSKKNFLYSFSIPLSIKLSNIIVTPSKNAYLELNIPDKKWHVIHNKLDNEYLNFDYKINPLRSAANILFIDGDREYKGGKLFSSVRDKFDVSLLNGGKIYSTKDIEFIDKFKFYGRLTPEIYSHFSIVLILTDNKFWKETFGLVGCEAASSGAIPLFTDSFAYPEIWREYADKLHIKEYSEVCVIESIENILELGESLCSLQLEIKNHVVHTCGKEKFIRSWLKLIE